MKDRHRQECVSDRAECAHSKDYRSSGGPNTGHFRNLNTQAPFAPFYLTRKDLTENAMFPSWHGSCSLKQSRKDSGREVQPMSKCGCNSSSGMRIVISTKPTGYLLKCLLM